MLKGNVKYYLRRNIYGYFDSFWIMKSNGIHPQILSNKTLRSVGYWGIDDEAAIVNV